METKNKTKILFAIPSLLVGGTERQLIKQLNLFDKDKFDIHLLTLFSYDDVPNLQDKIPEYIKLYNLNLNKKIYFTGILKVKNILKKINPDVVISSAFSANTIFRILQPIFNYKCIAREHNIYYEKKWWQKLLDKILASRSHKIVAVSKSVAEFSSRQAGIPIEKFEVIHNGVEIDFINNFRNSNPKDFLRQKLGIQQDETIFLNVGRLKKQKQQDILIESFKNVVLLNQKAKLFIVGRGPEENYLKQKIAENKLQNNVFLTGYTEDVYDYYGASDVFVLSSKYEGFPNVAIEAMAFGLPVISTKVPGVDEFLIDGQNGFLLEDSIENFSDVMKKFLFLDKESLLKMKEESEKTAKGFDIKDTVKKYTELYVN